MGSTSADDINKSKGGSASKSDSALNPKSVPSGGKDTKCDPGAQSGKTAGTGSVGNSSKPFKGLK